jgi:hypothetical protein
MLYPAKFAVRGDCDRAGSVAGDNASIAETIEAALRSTGN